jgi:hypothetical protein
MRERLRRLFWLGLGLGTARLADLLATPVIGLARWSERALRRGRAPRRPDRRGGER